MLLPIAIATMQLGSLALAACPEKLPSWTFKDMTIKFGAEVRTGGSAAWTFTNTVTGKSDSLTCRLQANSRCEINGTPSDKGVHIYLQTTLETLLVTVDQTVTCDAASKHVIGTTAFDLTCPESRTEAKTCTLATGTVDGAPPTL